MKLRLFNLALAVAVGSTVLVRAQAPIVLPEVSFKRLLNDLEISVAPTPKSGEAMTIGLVVRYGSAFDPVDKGGLAYLLTKAFARGTLDRTARDIQDELGLLGGSLEIRTDWDGFRFLVQCPPEFYERALLLLYQVAAEAVFNDADLNQAKAEALKDLARPEDPRERILRQFDEVLFAGTTYGRALTGTENSIENVTTGDIRLFYRRYFSPNVASLIVVGAVPAAEVLQKATRIWGVWVRREEVPFTFVQPRKPGARNIFLEDDAASPAAQFIMGGLWPVRNDPSYYATTVAARVLQERLTKALPTSLVTVGWEGRRMTGPFYLQGQAAADQAVQQISKILEVVEEIRASPPQAEEVATARKGWTEDFARLTKTNSGLCSLLLDTDLYRLGTNYAAAFPDILARLTPQDIRDAAKEWLLPGGVVLLVRGPATVLRPALQSSLGTVQTLAP